MLVCNMNSILFLFNSTAAVQASVLFSGLCFQNITLLYNMFDFITVGVKEM